MTFDPNKFTIASYPQEVQISSGMFRFDDRARSRHGLMDQYTHCRMMFDVGTGTVAMELLDSAVNDDTMVLEMEMKKVARQDPRVTVKVKLFFESIEYEPSQSLRAQYTIEEVDGKVFAVFKLPEYNGPDEDEVFDDIGDPPGTPDPDTDGVDLSDTVAVQHEIEVYLGERTHATVNEILNHVIDCGAVAATINDIRSALHKMDEVEKLRGGFYKLKTGSVSRMAID